MVNNWIDYILTAVYPAICRRCGADGHQGLDLCRRCIEELPLNDHGCARCARPLPPAIAAGRCCGHCQQHDPPYSRVLAPYLYREPLDNLVNALKHRQQLADGRLLAALLGRCVLAEQRALPQLLLPLPAHAQRLRERGFNQAAELTRWLSRQLRIPWRADLLRRSRWTTPQQALSRAQRLSNVRGSFHCGSTGAIGHVALVDDVVTTGATIDAAALALRRAGIREVEVWAVARTP